MESLDIHTSETEEGELLNEYEIEGGVESSNNRHFGMANDNMPEPGTFDPGAQALGNFLNETQPPGDEEHSQGDNAEEVNDQYLSELANQCFEKQGPAVATPVAKLVNNHLARDFSAKLGTSRTNEDSSQSGLVMAKLKNIPVPTNLTELRSCRVNDAMTPMTP